MNQMRPVAKRDYLYTLSLFALKLCLLRLKYILKLRKHTFKNIDKFFGIVPGDSINMRHGEIIYRKWFNISFFVRLKTLSITNSDCNCV